MTDANSSDRNATDPIALAVALMAAPSITPATGTVFDALEAALLPLGFQVDRFVKGEAPDGPVENLFATRAGTGSSGRRLGKRSVWS
jgi:succinyl-diaminopimelate desuccinylase